MDFWGLEEKMPSETRMMADSLKTFFSKKKFPIKGKKDPEGVISLVNNCWLEERFPDELLPGLIDLGCLSATPYTNDYGCTKVDYMTYLAMARWFEFIDSGLRSYFSVTSSLVRYAIFAFGTEEQKRKFISGITDGSLKVCFALTDLQGSEPHRMVTHARRDGNKYIINGRKKWITNAPTADICVAWVKTGDDAASIRGFIIEKGTSGYNPEKITKKGPLRASDTGDIVFEECVVGEDALLPGTDRALGAAFASLAGARSTIASGVIGSAIACFMEALTFAVNREIEDDNFGKLIKLVKHPVMRNYFYEMERKISDMQLRVYHLADALNRSNGVLTNSVIDKISASKLNVDDAIQVASQALHILASNGILVEGNSCVWRHFCNLQAVKIYEGTSEIHKKILGRRIIDRSAI